MTLAPTPPGEMRVLLSIEEDHVDIANVDPGDPRLSVLRHQVAERFGVVFTRRSSVDDVFQYNRESPRRWKLYFEPSIPEDRAEEAYEFSKTLDMVAIPTPPLPSLDAVISTLAKSIATEIDTQVLQDMEEKLGLRR